MRKLGLVPVCVVLASCLGIAACGSSSSSSNSSKSTSKNTNAPVELAGKVNDHGSKDVSAQGATEKLEIEADDVYFGPTFVKAAPGATVTVELHNEGKMEHTFTIDGTSVDQDLKPDQKVDVDVKIPDNGALQFHCRFHGNQGMQGAFYTATGAKVSNNSDANGSGYGY